MYKNNLAFLNKGGRRNVFIKDDKVYKKLIKKSNLNFNDFKIYKLLCSIIPKKYELNFMKIYDLDEDFLICELIKNFDDSVSKNMKNFGLEKLDSNFFEKIKEIILFLLDKNFYYYDIRPENILVLEIKKENYIPVFCDYKNINRKYPLQINLLFENSKRKKVIRRFNRFLELYLSKKS